MTTRACWRKTQAAWRKALACWWKLRQRRARMAADGSCRRGTSWACRETRTWDPSRGRRGSTVPRRGGQLYSGWAVNSISTARQVFEHKAKGSHPLFRKGENVPSSHRPIVPLRWLEFAKNRESSILLLYIIIIIYNNKIIITPLSPHVEGA